jgi:hypothetical protein
MPPSPPNPPPPEADTRKVPEAQATLVIPTGIGVLGSVFVLIPIFLLIAFHVGAGYLSYQKYGNLGWAFVNFLFAYFYYPYYAFFLAKEPAPSGLPAMVGGKRGILGGVGKALGKLMK